MTKASPVRVRARVERKHPRLPRFVVIPGSAVAAWGLQGTTVVEGSLDGVDLGRRSLKRWGEERWFIDLPEPLCRRAGVATGESVTLEVRLASQELPEELARLLADDPTARARWQELTPSRRRSLREHVLAANQPATRKRRAARALGLRDET